MFGFVGVTLNITGFCNFFRGSLSVVRDFEDDSGNESWCVGGDVMSFDTTFRLSH